MEKNVEKRKFPRANTHIPLKYKQLRASGGMAGTGTITKNLSEGGVRFRASEFVAMACRLILELDMPQFDRPIKAISKVAWIRKVASGDDYEIGNQFLEISKEDKKHVSEYIEQLVSGQDPAAQE